jgi:hypothetical protein
MMTHAGRVSVHSLVVCPTAFVLVLDRIAGKALVHSDTPS